MDQGHNQALTQRLHYSKCTQCRNDKKKCLPRDRTWPLQKCDRCAKYNYACSPSMTTKQERQWSQNSSLAAFLLAPSSQDQPEARVVVNGAPSPRKDPSEQQNDGSFIKPKCAVYFSMLMKANWEDFGLQISIPDAADIPATLVAYGRQLLTREACYIYSRLRRRLAAVDFSMRYSDFLQKAILEGMSEAASRDFAYRKLIVELLQQERDRGNQDQDLAYDDIQKFDKLLSIGHRWRYLIDTIGVPEIALIGHDEREEVDWDDVPVLDIQSGSKEYPPLLAKLLDPALKLKETCLKLNGVIGMIERLKGLDQSEFRTFLIEEIRRRVKDILGEPKRALDLSDNDDESMADADTSQSNVAGLGALKGFDFSGI